MKSIRFILNRIKNRLKSFRFVPDRIKSRLKRSRFGLDRINFYQKRCRFDLKGMDIPTEEFYGPTLVKLLISGGFLQ